MTVEQIADLTRFVKDKEAEFDQVYGSAEGKINQVIGQQTQKLETFFNGKVGAAIRKFLKASNHKCLLHSKPYQSGVLRLFLTQEGFETVFEHKDYYNREPNKTGCDGAIFYLCDAHGLVYSSFHWPFSGYVDKCKKVAELKESLENCLKRIGKVGDEAIGMIENKFAQLAKELR